MWVKNHNQLTIANTYEQPIEHTFYFIMLNKNTRLAQKVRPIVVQPYIHNTYKEFTNKCAGQNRQQNKKASEN